MAQAAHGSAPDIAGRNIANPIAMILSSGMLLQWLGARRNDATLLKAAELVEAGVENAVKAGTMTPDMGGSTGTKEFGTAVARLISQQ
jgi:3-isopropylmalate dehydrogenase